MARRKRTASAPASDPVSNALRPLIAQLVDERLAVHLRAWLAANAPHEVPTERDEAPAKVEVAAPPKGSNGTKKHGNGAPAATE